MKRALIVAVCCCAWAGIVPAVSAQDAQEPASRDLIRVLHLQIETRDLQGTVMSLKDALNFFHDIVAARGVLGKDAGLPILVDQKGFKEVAPDSGDIFEGQVQFPPYPKKMTLAMALQHALSQASPVEATYVIRRGVVEIMPAKNATLANLLKQTVLANYEQERLDGVLHNLAKQTGVSIQLDPRAKDKHAMQITALFRNDTSLRDVLTILANMADLQVVELGSAVYVTTPANAEALRNAQPRQKPCQPAADPSPK
jgi:hypothetical protein